MKKDMSKQDHHELSCTCLDMAMDMIKGSAQVGMLSLTRNLANTVPGLLRDNLSVQDAILEKCRCDNSKYEVLVIFGSINSPDKNSRKHCLASGGACSCRYALAIS